MQLIVPMAGFGERFRAAGWTIPKPLIPVMGRTMAAHVVDLFPGVDRVVLLASDEQLANRDWRMREILASEVPRAEIVSVPAHRRGPVHTLALGREAIDPHDSVALAMCDLCFDWDFADFARTVSEQDADGAVVVYRGFHPHLLRSLHYGFVRERGGVITDIQEKASYTPDPIGNLEPCSNGVYWVRSGRMLNDYVDALEHRPDLPIGGELYVSQIFDPMLRDGRKVITYDTDAYCQWGNPEDLRDWMWHERGFRLRSGEQGRPRLIQPPARGTLLLPMAGLGQRFADAGHREVKPLIPVDGQPMVVAAARDLPAMDRTVFVQRKDLPGLDRIQAELDACFPGCTQVVLDGPTDGQARTVALGLQRAGVDLSAPVVVGACDNGLLYDAVAHAQALGEADALLWGMAGHPGAALHPRMYGWIDADADRRVRGVSVKVPLADPATDPAVVGTFSFARAGDLLDACEALFARDGRVRGEFYLDSAVADLIAAGRDVRLFPVDHYEGWGTPDDLATHSYWQRFFSGWAKHPYDAATDPRVRKPEPSR